MRIAILDDFQSIALRHESWARLHGRAQVVAFGDHIADPDQLALRLQGFDALCLMRERTPIAAALMDRLPRLRLVLCTGRRNHGAVDLPAAAARGIAVCYTEASGTSAAELAMALILNLFRRVNVEAAAVRAGGWQTGLGSSLEGSVLGILGLGTFGSRVATMARAFGMEVRAWSPNIDAAKAAVHGATAVSKAELFAHSDAVTIHMPLSDRSRGIVGRPEIGQMAQTAFLVNTSRAGLIDHAALVEALRANRIAGYATDVFHDEPPGPDHPFRYLPNVLATPHIGYVTRQNYEVFYRQTVENILAFLDGAPIRLI